MLLILLLLLNFNSIKFPKSALKLSVLLLLFPNPAMNANLRDKMNYIRLQQGQKNNNYKLINCRKYKFFFVFGLLRCVAFLYFYVLFYICDNCVKKT